MQLSDFEGQNSSRTVETVAFPVGVATPETTDRDDTVTVSSSGVDRREPAFVTSEPQRFWWSPERMGETVVSKNVTYLREHGPAPAEELPEPVATHGEPSEVQSFRASDGGSWDTAVDSLTTVYYLPEHDPETVVRAFCECNPEVLETTDRQGFARALGAPGMTWRAAAGRLATEFQLGEREEERGAFDADAAGECPLCGASLRRPLPGHLRNDCEEN